MGCEFHLHQVGTGRLQPQSTRSVPADSGRGDARCDHRFYRQVIQTDGRAWVHVAVSSIFANVIPYLLLSYGELHTSAGLAGVLIGGTPLVTLFISTVALQNEPATGRKVAGFILGFLGVALVVSPWNVEGVPFSVLWHASAPRPAMRWDMPMSVATYRP